MLIIVGDRYINLDTITFIERNDNRKYNIHFVNEKVLEISNAELEQIQTALENE